jgi:hypothetical protein
MNFRNGLQGLEGRLQFGTSLLGAVAGGTPRRAPPSNAGETLVVTLALVISTFVTVGALRSHAAPLNLSAILGENKAILQRASGLEARVDTVARAIAVAEGYYAPGDHDGHSLPHLLNNPGSLKRPVAGADKLQTWKETGLLIFPNELAGWNALKHQVRLMLTGQSSVYRMSDKISDVASKYADGDANWGINVARQLRVDPTMTLAELLGPPGTQPMHSLPALASMINKPSTGD